jgi:hypothetical protein
MEEINVDRRTKNECAGAIKNAAVNRIRDAIDVVGCRSI